MSDTILDMDKRQLEIYPPPDKRLSPMASTSAVPRAPKKWTGSLPDKFIASIVTRISRAKIQDWVNALCKFQTRHTESVYIDQVAGYLRDEFAAMGYANVGYHPYIKNGLSLKNVICAKPGVSDSGQVVVVCGHYDCVMEQHSNSEARAPGADDNASGIAAMLEIARILYDVELEHTVRFVAFSGEEQGLWGSTAYAQHLQDNGVNLYRLINLDMIGYPPEDNAVIIEMDMGNNRPENDAASQQLGQVMTRMAADYTGLATVQSNIYASDYMPFEARGYVVAGVYEGGDCPWYHTSGDTPDIIDYEYLTEVARLTLCTLLEETLAVKDETETPVDLYIRDSSEDTGTQPSGCPHWTSPDIWVRNDPSDYPGEDPANGHQPPVNGIPNYLYVRVHNRGTQAAGPVSVSAYRCDPATGMIWPDHFEEIGTITLTDEVPAGGSLIAGPFLWTPQVVDHECLLAVASCEEDHAIPDIYRGRFDHSLLVRFDNNVGQRNVCPEYSIPGGKTKASVLLRGGTVPSINTLAMDASNFPMDSIIEIRVPRRLSDEGRMVGLVVAKQNSRWCYYSLREGFKGELADFSLDAAEQAAVTLTIDTSHQAEHGEVYHLNVTQKRNDSVVGRYTVEITAVKESDDYVYGNRRSRELHTIHCPFLKAMDAKNIVPFPTIRAAKARGYNGCAFCFA